MDRLKTSLILVGIGIVVGVIIAWVLFTVLGAEPREVSVGPVKFELPTEQTEASVTTVTPTTPLPTVTPIPTSRPPTSVPLAARWVQEVSQVPESGTQLTWELAAAQVMFLSGGQFQVGDVFCGGDAQQICVLIYESSEPQTVVVESVIPQHNYVGITEMLSPEEALNDKEPLFWIPPNCVNGCKRATILFFRDGQLIDTVTRTAP